MNMKMLLKGLCLGIFFVGLTACTTSYGPSGFTGGYEERKVSDDAYIVSFYGNGNTSDQQVWNFWIYRCAELTLQKGYELFELQPSNEHAVKGQTIEGELVAFTMLDVTQIINQTTNPVIPVQVIVTTVTSYSSKALVKMYKQPIPLDAGLLLDAQVILDELKPYVESNTQKAAPAKKVLFLRAAVEAAIRANRVKREDSESLKEQLEQVM
jgi:hypothetical protein